MQERGEEAGSERPEGASADRPLAPGAVFAGHRIEAEIGRGGMGIVYRARHLALDRVRALKVLPPALSANSAYVERFRRESRLAAAVEHPSVVAVHHAGEEDGRLYIAMHYVDGVDLGRLLEEGPLRPPRALALLGQVAAGLDAAHAGGLVHRDIKPENVLLSGELDDERAYITDFGIGRLLPGEGREEGRLTAGGVVLGTPDYVAPEQIEGGSVEGRADVYSLGCVAFHTLTGRPPFAAETDLATLAAHGAAPRPRASRLNDALPPPVDSVLAQAMALDPDARPATAGELVSRLAAAIDGTAPSGAAVTRPLAPPRSVRPWQRAALAAGVLAALAALATVLLAGETAEEPPAARIEAARTIDVPRDPVGVAAGAERVWVGSRAAERVTAFDTATSERTAAYSIPRPRAVALGFGYLWVVSRDGLLRLDLDDGDASRVAELADPSDVATGRRWVWVLDREPAGRVLRIDPLSLRVSGEAFVGREPRALAAGARAVWVTNTEDGTISRIDPRTARTTGRPISVGGRPTDLAARGGSVWVVDNFRGRLTRVDPSPPAGVPAVTDVLDTDARPRGVAAGFGSVWVANGEAGTVWRYSAGTEPALQAIAEVGDEPADVSVGSGAVWTADSRSGTVSRIDP